MRDRATERRERLAALLRQALAHGRRVAGMPDYGAYVRHLEAAHPDQPVPSEREFFALYLSARYGDGPTRCC